MLPAAERPSDALPVALRRKSTFLLRTCTTLSVVRRPTGVSCFSRPRVGTWAPPLPARRSGSGAAVPGSPSAFPRAGSRPCFCPACPNQSSRSARDLCRVTWRLARSGRQRPRMPESGGGSCPSLAGGVPAPSDPLVAWVSVSFSRLSFLAPCRSHCLSPCPLLFSVSYTHTPRLSLPLFPSFDARQRRKRRDFPA